MLLLNKIGTKVHIFYRICKYIVQKNAFFTLKNTLQKHYYTIRTIPATIWHVMLMLC